MSDVVDQPDAAPTEVMACPIGATLRAAREARGLQLAEVAATLKLGQRQVEALEQDDWTGLPGNTFIRGFVRNYARLLNVDPTPLMASLDQRLQVTKVNLDLPPSDHAEVPMRGASSSKRDRLVVIVGLLILLLAAVAYVLLPSDLSSLLVRSTTENAEKPAAVVEPPKAEVAPAAAPNEPLFPPAAPGVPPAASIEATAPVSAVAVQAVAEKAPALAAPTAAPVNETSVATSTPALRFLVKQASWVEVRDRDNKILLSQRLAAGAEQAVSGQGPFSLVIGYAPGVNVQWRGQVVDLSSHTKGDVARLVLE